MASAIADFASPGKVTSVNGDLIVFAPRGTNYQMHLKPTSPYGGELNAPVDAVVHLNARKIWTVPSGGNFITPIVGPPRIIQGRVRQIDEKQIVVQAGATFVVHLPANDSGIDLPKGPITLGRMVNVTAYPGATVELLDRRQA